MGLQSFLSHAQNDPGTQEAIRKLLERGDAPKPPQSISDSPPTRDQIPYDDPNVDIPPERTALAQPAPPVRAMPSSIETPMGILPATPPVRLDPRQGVSTVGMSPMDAAQARLKATQGASPQSRIDTSDPNFVEVAPPHGISRLKAAGRLFLDQLKRGHGLIGGLFGLGEGLIAPSHAQDLKHEQEVAEAQGNLDQVAGNAKTQAQIEDINAQVAERTRQASLPPKRDAPHEDFRIVNDGEYPDVPKGTAIKRLLSDTTGKFEDEVTTDAQGVKHPTIKALAPVRAPHEPLVKMIKNADGSETAFQSNDFGETWVLSKLPVSAAPLVKEPPQSNQWQVTNQAIDENIAGFRLRQSKIDDFLKTAPASIKVAKPHKYGTVGDDFVVEPNPDYVSAKKERNELDNKIAEENGKRKAAPPTRSTTSTDQYAGKPWSLTQWRAKNPNATPEQESAAKAKAVNAQMKVVD